MSRLTPENFKAFLYTKRFEKFGKPVLECDLNQFKSCSEGVRRHCAQILLSDVVEHIKDETECLPSDDQHALANITKKIHCEHTAHYPNQITFMTHLCNLIGHEMSNDTSVGRIAKIAIFLKQLNELRIVEFSFLLNCIQYQMKNRDDIFVQMFRTLVNSIENQKEELSHENHTVWQEFFKDFTLLAQKVPHPEEFEEIGFQIGVNLDLIQLNDSNHEEILAGGKFDSIGQRRWISSVVIQRGLVDMTGCFPGYANVLMYLPWASREERENEIRKCIIHKNFRTYRSFEFSEYFVPMGAKFIIDLFEKSVISIGTCNDILGRIIKSARCNRLVAKAQVNEFVKYYGQGLERFYGEEIVTFMRQNSQEYCETLQVQGAHERDSFEDDDEATSTTVTNKKSKKRRKKTANKPKIEDSAATSEEALEMSPATSETINVVEEQNHPSSSSGKLLGNTASQKIITVDDSTIKDPKEVLQELVKIQSVPKPSTDVPLSNDNKILKNFVESLWKKLMENPEQHKDLANYLNTTVQLKIMPGLFDNLFDFFQQRMKAFASINSSDYSDKIRSRLEGVLMFLAEIYRLDLITEETLKSLSSTTVGNLSLSSLKKFNSTIISATESKNIQMTALVSELQRIESHKLDEFWPELKKDIDGLILEYQEKNANDSEDKENEGAKKKEEICENCKKQQNKILKSLFP